MTNRTDFGALNWVKDEIDQTIRKARQILESHVERETDVDSLVVCADHLHQIGGVLRMAQVYGPGKLAEEMEAVVRAMAAGQVAQRDDAAEALMLALIQLPDYLELLQSRDADVPLLILPLLNELRAVRKAPLLSEIALFQPAIDKFPITTKRQGGPNPDLPTIVRRLRQILHTALLTWFRNQDAATAWQYLQEVFDELEQQAGTPHVFRLAWVSGAMVRGLQDQSITPGVELKQLFGKIDRQLKGIIDNGEDGWVDDQSDELLKSMLYHIAHADSDNQQIQAVKRAFDLVAALPSEVDLTYGRHGLSGSNAELAASIGEAIQSELTRIKDVLDLFMRKEHADTEMLSHLERPMRKLAGTLGMIGQGELAARLLRQADKVKSIITQSVTPEEYELMEMAGDILYVESSLGTLQKMQSTKVDEKDNKHWGLRLPESEYGNLIKQTVREAKVDIAKAKEAIIGYTEAPNDTSVLNSVYEGFVRVCGALKLLDFMDAARVLEQTADFIKTDMIVEAAVTTRQQLNLFADIISSIEYFLEALVDGAGNRSEIVAIAQSALDVLLNSRLEPEAIPNQAEIIPFKCAEQTDQETHETLQPNEPVATLESAEDITNGHSLDVMAVDETVKEEDAPVPAQNKPALEDIDPEILEIFIEEAREELESIRQYLPAWQSNREDHNALSNFRRSFHTLKGSGRLVGAKAIGELAWSVENMLNRVIDETIKPSTEMMEFLDEVVRILPELIERQEHGEANAFDLEGMMQRAFALAEGRTPAESSSTVVRGDGVEDELQQPTTQPLNEEVERRGDERKTDLEVPENIPSKAESSTVVPKMATKLEVEGQESDGSEFSDSDITIEIDSELLRVFSEESENHLAVLEAFIEQTRSSEPRLNIGEEIIRAYHTLHGSARMTGITPIANLSKAVENYLKILSERNLLVDEGILSLLEDSVGYIRQFLAWLHEEEKQEPNADSYLTRLATAQDEALDMAADSCAVEGQPELASVNPQPMESLPEVTSADSSGLTENDSRGSPKAAVEEGLYVLDEDPELVDIFIEEAKDLIESLENSYSAWVDDSQNSERVTQVQRILHTLKGSARLAGVLPVGDLSHSLESVFIDLVEGRQAPSERLSTVIRQVIDKLANQVDEIESTGKLHSAEALIGQLESIRSDSGKEPEFPTPSLDVADNTATEQKEVETDEDYAASLEAVSYLQTDDMLPVGDDPELVGIFIEEAREIMEHLEAGYQQWSGNPADLSQIDGMQRSLHTLKGSARLAGITPVGNLSHALESLLIKLVNQKLEASDAVLMSSRQVLDKLANQIDEIATLGQVSSAESVLEQLERLIQPEKAQESRDAVSQPSGQAGHSPVEVQPQAPAESAVVLPLVSDIAKESNAKRQERAAQFKPSKDQVRIDADLMDRLVNHAGEVSIYRARLEQQNNVLGFNLAEMEQTVSRLFTQLRNLEIETEAQILYRWDRDNERDDRDKAEFDPLELDRFSTMQQLSRALVETVSDLGNIYEAMADLQRETDTLLLQQSRISTDLQDGLLRTRMVPFTQLVPRLQRLVRQTGGQLGKQAQLEVIGSEGELDRNILNRMIPVLEHLLRNAVSHGIESPNERTAAGKQASGQISLSIEREATDVLITLADDGKGLDIEAIRMQAIRQGIIHADAEVSDDDLIQCVLNPGFSTAKEVTQISGRGVGLDVVASEVKQLSGSLDIDSKPGQGTRFTIRLPLTLAITDALLVRIGEEIYAIPHGGVEGVVRIKHPELQTCYQDEQHSYQYADHSYNVVYLGHMMGVETHELTDNLKWYPLLLVHAGEHHVALQVDELLGTHQIVVKSVGKQIGSVRWITGGTILADGRVALILDASALVRMDAAQVSTGKTALSLKDQKSTEERIRVMVVDDSITV
ncbi:MAG: Hpt domain-containing protein, partial [Chromatiales bacterium]